MTPLHDRRTDSILNTPVADRDGPKRPRVLLLMGPTLSNLIELALRHGRYETRTSTEASDCRRVLSEWSPHLMILDFDNHGAFVRSLARGTDRRTPLLAFTRRRDTAMKLRAFEDGVDDIVEVPFRLDEIIARPYAIMRRAHGLEVELVPKIRIGEVAVDLARQRIELDGQRLEITPIEQTMLYLLAANQGRILSREQMITDIWGQEFEIESNVVDRHVRELRVKLGDDWRKPRFIETVAGKGYRFLVRTIEPSRR